MRNISRFMLTMLILILIPIGVFAFDGIGEIPAWGGQDFVQQTEPSSTASVRIVPREGQQGDSHSILVSGLQVGEEVTLRITRKDSGEEVYTTRSTANENGRFQIEIFTTNSDEPGEYAIEVENLNNIVIGSATLTILEPASLNAVIDIEPASAIAGTHFSLDLSGANPFSDLEFVILNEAQERVFTSRIRATVDGNALIEFRSTPRDGGTYTVRILDGDTEVASGTFVVDGPLYIAETEIIPAEVEPGEDVIISVTGLEPEAAITAMIEFAGSAIHTEGASADVNGTVILLYSTQDALPGIYDVSILEQGDEISQANYTVIGDFVELSVTPQDAPLNRTFVVSIHGLPSGENALLEVLDGDQVILSRELTGDSNDSAVVLLNGANGLTVGTFDIQISREGITLAHQEIVVRPIPEEAEQPTPEPTDTPAEPGEISLTINPETGPIPTNYAISASGLAPNSAVTLNIKYEGSVVYSVNLISNSEGIIETGVVSEESDPRGAYELELTQNGTILATTTFAIADETSITPPEQASPVLVSVEPGVVTKGELFDVVVSGLEASASFDVEITFDGAVIFSTSRTADENGNAILNLQADESDQSGTYTVRIIQNRGITATEFIIQEATTQPADSSVAIQIEPESGTIGTDHLITVTGLEPGETVILDILLEGDSVYRTERTADDRGTFDIAITSEEGDPAGTYTISIIRRGEQLATADLVVTDPTSQQPPVEVPGDEPTLFIDPAEGPIGTTYAVIGNGLPPTTEVTFEIVFGGEVIYQTQRTTDALGGVMLSLTSEESDPEGVYTVRIVSAESETLAQSNFAIGAGAAVQPTQSPPDQAQGEVQVSIDPVQGEIGTTHTITITGLETNEDIEIAVSINGETVYTTNRTADTNGSTTLNLVSEEGDPAGTYVVSIIRNGETLGSAEFIVSSVDATPPPSEEDITESYTDQLTMSQPEQRFSFYGEEGQTVIIRHTSDELDAYLQLESERGEILAENDDSGGGTNAQIGPYTLPYSGAYTIIASSYSAISFGEAQAGAFTLTIETVDVQIRAVTLDSGSQSITDRLSNNSPSIYYTFEGQADQMVLVSLQSNDFDSFLILQDEAGNELIRNDDGGGEVLNAQIGPYTLPYTGTYTVIASSYSYINYGESIIGAFAMRLEYVTSQEITYGSPQTLELNSEQSSQLLTFTAQAGEVISVDVASNGSVDTRLSIIDPDGFVVFSDDDGGAGFDPEVSRYVVPISGTYTLHISTYAIGASGSVQVTINQDDVRSLDTETRIVQISSKQSSDILTLQGFAGDQIRLNIRLLSGEIGNMTISVNQGSDSLMFYQTYGMPQDINLGFEVLQDGPVNITVEDLNTTGATLEFSITQGG